MDRNTGETLFEDISPEQTEDVLAVVSRIVHPKGGASDRKIQKTYFLACVESIEDRLVALPAPRFFSWTYGPWSRDLRQLLEMSAADGAIEVGLVRSRSSAITRLYKWPSKNEIPPMRNPEDAAFVESFLQRVRNLSGDKLTALAKETAPYKHTDEGHPINLERYLDERKTEIENLSNDEKLAQLLATRAH